MEWQPEVIIKAAKTDGANADAENADPERDGTKTCRKIGALSHHIKNFMNQPELSDVLIHFAGKQYRSHRLILSAWSHVIEEKLSNAAKAGDVRGDPSQPFVLDCDEDVPSSGAGDDDNVAFQQFLKFLYSGKADVTERTVKIVLSLAQIYKIKPLQEMCERYIGREIGQHNIDLAIEWLGDAGKRDLALLQENCVKVLRSYIQYIPDKLWLGLRLDQLISIIESPDVVVDDEYTLFLKVETWIKSEQDKQADLWSNLDKILPHIRFSHMTIWQLKQFGQSTLGQLISQRHPAIITEALGARALASEEMDFSEVSENRFVAPRLYLRFVPPGGRLSSVKDKDKDMYSRVRCSMDMGGYSDRRAKIWRKRKGGLYRQADGETWEVTFSSREKASGNLWRVQTLVVPRWEHVGEVFKVVIAIKTKEDIAEPIIVTMIGTVGKGSKRNSADGVIMYTPYTLEDKPEYIYAHEVVYVG